MRQIRRAYDLEVKMSDEDTFSPYERHDAAIIGLTQVVKVLAAALCNNDTLRDFVEAELKGALADDAPKGVAAAKLHLYRAPISGALKAIESVNAKPQS